MEYCKYHPLQPATYVCRKCDINYCSECINNSVELVKPRCFHCRTELESFGASYGATPFWRRLEQSFRYPLNSQTLTFIVVIALLSTLISILPFSEFIKLPFFIVLVGAQLKYSFNCLEQTAAGYMQAPSVQGAYEGGTGLVLRLLMMIVLLFVGLYGFNYFFGATITGLLSLVFLLGIPAILINYALNDDIFEAINPLNILDLVSRIGLPYGLLIAFIFVMVASVNVIHEIIGVRIGFLSVALQSIASVYYTIVIFHIMGYVIFQYQGRLGFVASAIDGSSEHRQGHELYKAHVQVALKEGSFDEAYALLGEAIQRFPSDQSFYDKLFSLICYSKNASRLAEFGSKYLGAHLRAGRSEKMMQDYKKMIDIMPEFEPEPAELRYQLARAFHTKGDHISIVKLLNGLLSASPNFARVYDAYSILAQALEALPGMEENALECRKLLEKIEQSPVGATAQNNKQGKATFQVIDKSPDTELAKGSEQKTGQDRNKPVDFK